MDLLVQPRAHHGTPVTLTGQRLWRWWRRWRWWLEAPGCLHEEGTAWLSVSWSLWRLQPEAGISLASSSSLFYGFIVFRCFISCKCAVASCCSPVSSEIFVQAFEPPVYEKTSDQESRINDVLSKSFLFNALSKDDLKVILGAFLEKKIPAGDRIIQEGDDGDVMFLIESGAFDCIKKIDGSLSFHLCKQKSKTIMIYNYNYII